MEHKPIPSILLISAICCLIESVWAATPLPPASILLDSASYSKISLVGDERDKASLVLADVSGPNGKAPGLLLTTSEACSSPFSAQLTVGNSRPIQRGDVLWAHFFMRTTKSEMESCEGRVQFIVENVTTYDKSAMFTALAATQWKEFMFPFVAKESYPPGGADILFRIGFQRQDVEITGLELKDYGHHLSLADLPATKPDYRYAGMEPSAPWRAEAEARIEKYRKSQLSIKVVDASGNPVKGAEVEVAQTKHAYWFGSAVEAKLLAKPGDEKYREAVLKSFNLVTFENDLKWPKWNADRLTPLEAAEWCQGNGIALRGHNLVWPSWRRLPANVKTLEANPAALRQAVLDHVKDETTAVGSAATIWDVVNEPYDNHSLMDILGNGILADSFAAARAAAPDARLFMNDYGIITDSGLDRGHQANFEKNIRYLLDAKAPLDGIGIQGHFGRELTPPKRILEILDRFAAFGLPLEMTEFTMQVEDREIDAGYLRDVMTVFFSYPTANAFILWGFHDGTDFQHCATLYDANWGLTPCGKVWNDLVFHRWWTHETLRTTALGKARLRGFHGEYEVTVRDHGVESKTAVELKPGGSAIEIVLGGGGKARLSANP
jgi:GH35 family endo-1,4-beta-xylanase